MLWLPQVSVTNHAVNKLAEARSSHGGDMRYAFISLDYRYNVLLYGTGNSQLQLLQSAQNVTVRLATRSRRSDHISPILQLCIGCTSANESHLSCQRLFTSVYMAKLQCNWWTKQLSFCNYIGSCFHARRATGELYI